MDALKNQQPNLNNLIFLTTTETSSLLAQVAERIDDIRCLGEARRDTLQRTLQTIIPTSIPNSSQQFSNRLRRPVQIVSPEKKSSLRRASISTDSTPNIFPTKVSFFKIFV